MVSQYHLVFLVLAASFFKSGLSIGSTEYGLTQAEKVVKAVCWFEGGKNEVDPNSNCIRNVDYLETLAWLRRRTKQRDDVIFSWLPRNITRKITKTLPEYVPCTKYLNDRPKAVRGRGRRHARMFKLGRSNARNYRYQPVNRGPAPAPPPQLSLPQLTNYGWLLGDDDQGQYPYRNFNHCLLGLIETKHGKEALNDLQTHWGNTESLKAESVPEEENKGETDPEGEPEVEGQEEVEDQEEVEGRQEVDFTHESEYEETIIEEEFDESGNLLKRTQKITKKV